MFKAQIENQYCPDVTEDEFYILQNTAQEGSKFLTFSVDTCMNFIKYTGKDESECESNTDALSHFQDIVIYTKVA